MQCSNNNKQQQQEQPTASLARVLRVASYCACAARIKRCYVPSLLAPRRQVRRSSVLVIGAYAVRYGVRRRKMSHYLRAVPLLSRLRHAPARAFVARRGVRAARAISAAADVVTHAYAVRPRQVFRGLSVSFCRASTDVFSRLRLPAGEPTRVFKLSLSGQTIAATASWLTRQ